MNHLSQNRIHKPKAVGRDVDVDFHVTTNLNELLNGDQQGDKMIKSPPTSQRQMTANHQKLGELEILLARRDSYFEMNHQLSPSSELPCHAPHVMSEKRHHQWADILGYHNTKIPHSGKPSPDSHYIAPNQAKKTADFGVSNISVCLDANDNVGYQEAQRRKQTSCCRCQQDGKPGGLTSAKDHQIVLLVFCLVVIVFAMVVVHLHLRIQALEMRDNRPSKRPVKSDTGSVTNGMLIERNLIANSRMIHKKHMDHSRYIASKTGTDINNPRLIDSDKIAFKNAVPRKRQIADTEDEIVSKIGAYNQDQSRVANKMTFDGAVGGQNIRTGLSRGNKHSSSRWEYAYMMPAAYHSSDIEVRSGLPDVTSDSSEDGESMKFERQNLSPKKLSGLSRTVRSARGKSHRFNRSCPQCKKLQVETFVGSFYQHFDYDTYFKPKNENCITVEKWGVNVTACRDNTVMFLDANTTLPFLKLNTAQKSRLLSKTEGGKFHVKKPGDYLIHFSIMIVDEKEEHFLALYVNDKAMLACPRGGFLCPVTNDFIKQYRICNINGVVELDTGDTLSIRTMQPNVTVRIDDEIRKSYFKAVMLNPKKK